MAADPLDASQQAALRNLSRQLEQWWPDHELHIIFRRVTPPPKRSPAASAPVRQTLITLD